jgi:hypothetical protein
VVLKLPPKQFGDFDHLDDGRDVGLAYSIGRMLYYLLQYGECQGQ